MDHTEWPPIQRKRQRRAYAESRPHAVYVGLVVALRTHKEPSPPNRFGPNNLTPDERPQSNIARLTELGCHAAWMNTVSFRGNCF